MNTNISPQPWVEGGDRSSRDTTHVVSDSTAHTLMAEVNLTRAAMPAREARNEQTPSDYLVMAGLFGNNLDSKVEKAQSEAMRYYHSQDSRIFDVNSGRFAGMQVPENLRCAIFQSNIALKAGLINRSEVTVRAVEFGNLIKRKGYEQERFDPNRSYPNGSYIVGSGGGPDAESNHVAMVINGNLLHTRAGRIVNEPIRSKFPGSYSNIRVYVPPGSRR
ncbi:MAG: hypothetical protein IT343_14790 [Candidatus Melainabacteria bacterium]|nr:hypothetical protein [Candidatus Melainabacteria bacterium]